MMSFLDKNKGSISIFLILVLMPMYTCAYLAIDSARYSAAQSKINGALDLSGNSALANYNVPLRDLYGIFTMSQSERELSESLEMYFSTMLDASQIPAMEISFNTVVINRLIKRALSKEGSNKPLTFENAIVTSVLDFGGEYDKESALVNTNSFEKQIISLMKYRAPYNFALSTANKLSAFTQIDKMAEVLKKGSEYFSVVVSVEKELKNAACVVDSLKTNPNDDLEDKLIKILSALSEIKGKVSGVETKAKEWNMAIEKIEPGDLKNLLNTDYVESAGVLDKESIKQLEDTVKADLEYIKNGNGDSAGKQRPRCLDDPFFTYISRYNIKNAEEKKSDESIKELACTDLNTVYEEFDEVEISKLISPTILDLLTSGSTEDVADERNKAINSDLGNETFTSVDNLIKSIGSFAKAIPQNTFEAEYFTEMFSCFTTKNTDKTLFSNSFPCGPTFGAEVEYIIFGRDNKGSNMTCSTNLLLAVRMLMNSLYAFTNSEMRQTALSAATALSAFGGISVIVAQNLFLLTLSMAESILDVSSLCKGETVPIYKSTATWTTSPSGVAKILESGARDYVCRSIDDVFSVINGAAEDGLQDVIDAALNYMNRTGVATAEALTSMITTPIEAKLVTLFNSLPDVYTKEDLEGIIRSVLETQGNTSEGYQIAKEVFYEYCMPLLVDEVYESLPKSFSSDAAVAAATTTAIDIAIADIYEELFSRMEEKVLEYQTLAQNKILTLSGQVSEKTKKQAVEIIEKYTEKLGSFLGNTEEHSGTSVSTYSGVGMNYKDYMKLFALLRMSTSTGKEKMLKRALVLIQINCASVDGDFDIRTCYTKVKLKSDIKVATHKIEAEGIYEY